MSCNEWKEYKLDEVYTITNGLSKKRDEFGFGYEFLAFTDVFNNYFIPNTLSNLVNSTEKEREKCSIKRGDVFLTRTSEKLDELGRSCVALKDYPNATFNGFTKRLRPIGNVEILPEYVGYYFRSPKFRNAVTSMSSMTTRASLNNDMISVLTITVPPLEEQEKIANILSSLDDKIELNNDINKTLEEMAQAIFKRWFVDFEFPNADGKPYKSSGGEMVESDLGMIPKGWEVGTLKDLLDNIKVSVKAGKDLKGMPYLPIDTIPMKKLGINTYKSWEEAKSSLIKFNKNDILLGAMRVYFHRVVVPFEGITRSTCFVLRPKNSVDHSFLTLKLFEEDTISYANSMSKGTTMPYAVWENGLADMPTVIPNTVIRKIFDERIKNIIEAISTSCFEQYKLVELRDTLLPKLMSGEIDV